MHLVILNSNKRKKMYQPSNLGQNFNYENTLGVLVMVVLFFWLPKVPPFPFQ